MSEDEIETKSELRAALKERLEPGLRFGDRLIVRGRVLRVTFTNHRLGKYVLREERKSKPLEKRVERNGKKESPDQQA